MTTKQIIKILKSGGVGVLSTDTLYGLVGQALNPTVVESIYQLKQRQPDKPLIILINRVSELKKFGVWPTAEDKSLIAELWPGPISIIFPINDQKAKDRFSYLHRGTGALAFRFPRSVKLVKLLEKTGPLVAPSANPEGAKPAATITQAKKYFNRRVNFYQDGGRINKKASTLVALKNGKIVTVRP